MTRQHVSDVTSNEVAQSNALNFAMDTASDWDDLDSADSLSASGPRGNQGDNLSNLSEDTGSDEEVSEEVAEEDPKAATKASETKEEKPAETPSEEVTFAYNGKTLSVARPKDDKQLSRLLSKAYGADARLREAAEKVSQAEAKLAEAKATQQLPAAVSRAQSLVQAGHVRDAILELVGALGDKGVEFLNAFVQDEHDYQSASPADRLLKDANRKETSAQIKALRAQQDLDNDRKRLADEADANKARTYAGHVTDAFSKYDLSQWIEDSKEAESLNKTLKRSAFAEITRQQAAREKANQPDLTAAEISRIVGMEARTFVNLAGKRAEAAEKKAAAEKPAAVKEQIRQDNRQSGNGAKTGKAAAKKPQSMQDLVAQMFGVQRI